MPRLWPAMAWCFLRNGLASLDNWLRDGCYCQLFILGYAGIVAALGCCWALSALSLLEYALVGGLWQCGGLPWWCCFIHGSYVSALASSELVAFFIWWAVPVPLWLLWIPCGLWDCWLCQLCSRPRFWLSICRCLGFFVGLLY